VKEEGVLEGSKDSMQEELREFLNPTRSIDSDHPAIVAKARELTRECTTEVKKVKVLYEYVRDSNNDNPCEEPVASRVLKCGGNSCRLRSILLTALCRAVGIPARLHYQKVWIEGWRDPRDGKKKDIIFAHGLTGIYLNGDWRLYEVVGNKEKWVMWTGDEDRAREMPVEFHPDRDCLFKLDGNMGGAVLPVHFADWGEEVERLIEGIDDYGD
jgi:transglutaminase-like putative cysteine protease